MSVPRQGSASKVEPYSFFMGSRYSFPAQGKIIQWEFAFGEGDGSIPRLVLTFSVRFTDFNLAQLCLGYVQRAEYSRLGFHVLESLISGMTNGENRHNRDTDQ